MNPPLPRGLYGVCDDTVRTERSLEEKLDGLLEGGVRVVQLRLKRTSPRAAAALAQALAHRCRAAGAELLINDRVDLALLCNAAGVHLGDDDLPARLARRLLPLGARIGVTVRSAEGARRARDEGADYVGVGPVFATATKAVAHPALGLEGLREVVRESPLPVVAIAGITLANIEAVAATGVRCAAVVSDLLGAEDLPARARALDAAFARGALRVASPEE